MPVQLEANPAEFEQSRHLEAQPRKWKIEQGYLAQRKAFLIEECGERDT